eukprot:maker-scaffold_7-snap-gene-10.30-mRNA-1 protein AED:0.03 eAED:0.03 QI:75/1/1/1/0.75/0.4/5/223/500
MAKETDKMDVEEKKEETDSENAQKVAINIPNLFTENISLITRAVTLDDPVLIRRVFTRNTPIRRHLNLLSFQSLVSKYFKSLSSQNAQDVKNAIFETLDPLLTVSVQKSVEQEKQVETISFSNSENLLLETESYFWLFIVSKLIEAGDFPSARKTCKNLLTKLNDFNRQTLDNFYAKTYQLFSLSLDLDSSSGSLEWNDFINSALKGYRTSCLRFYFNSQATLTNLILAYHINSGNYGQAKAFDENAKSPMEVGSSNITNAQLVRYMYYKARICAIESEYSKSDQLSTMAIRKTPTTTSTGMGFLMAVHKLSIVTKLLIGDIPEKQMYKNLKFTRTTSFLPYFSLVRVVRTGSVKDFEQLMAQHNVKFEADGLGNLVGRLRGAVIRRGLRRINLSYSRISFKELENKLGVENVEMICAKAIRDGILTNAVISGGELISQEKLDMYSKSLQPKEEFSKRADFCSNVYMQAMKAHKYPAEQKEKEKDTEGIWGEEFENLAVM